MKRFILIVLLCWWGPVVNAQGNLDLNIGTARTELRNNALRFGVNYAADVFSGFSDGISGGRKNLFFVMPEFAVEEGSEDAFSSIIVKAAGFTGLFKKTSIDGIEFHDLQRTFHVIPFSAGIETNGAFSILNLIGEAGYFPWYQQPQHGFLRLTRVGVFLQGGYKFSKDTANIKFDGGAKEEGKETPGNGVFRAKFTGGINTKNVLKTAKGAGLELIGDGNLWYDIVNSCFYYKLSGKARICFTKKYYFDLFYERGSGAPNFNEGDQFGVNLGVAF